MKNHFKLFFGALIFFYNFAEAQITTEITNIKVNGNTVSSVNFHNNSTIDISFEVKMSTFNGDFNNLMGNLYVFTKMHSNAPQILRTSQAVAFVAQYPPFVPQITYTNTSYLNLTLSREQFYASGGIIYASFINNAANIFNTTEISINGGNSTNPPVGSLSEYLRIEEIRNAETQLPIEDIIYIAANGNPLQVNLDYSRMLNLGQSCSGYFRIIKKDRSGNITNTADLSSIPGGSCFSDGIPINGTFSDIYLNPSEFVTKGSIQLVFDNVSNYKKWHSTPRLVELLTFTENEIFIPNSQITIGSNANIGGLNTQVRIIDELNSGGSRPRYIYIPVTSYKWFKKVGSGAWIELTENSSNYNFSVYETAEYMRKAYYKGANTSSNIIQVNAIPIFQEINSICCSQSLASYQIPQMIIGNLPEHSGQINYQWQSQSRGYEWKNVIGATEKDFLPPTYETGVVNYRRIVTLLPIQNTYISNIVTTSFGRRGISRLSSDELNDDSIMSSPSIYIYPTPSSSSLFFEGNALEGTTIGICDLSGRMLMSYQIEVNEVIKEFNISNLPLGTYLAIIKFKDNKTIVKKIVKN